MELGPHAHFIWAAYGGFAAILAVLAVWLIFDGKRQAAALAELEARGVKRRSER